MKFLGFQKITSLENGRIVQRSVRKSVLSGVDHIREIKFDYKHKGLEIEGLGEEGKQELKFEMNFG